MAELLYKYRSLENIERFLDIIIEKKLYGALYKEMNDLMEGYFQYSPVVNKELIRNIWDSKNKSYICSLSKKSDIGLMWSHYADENKGCCFEVEVTSKKIWKRLEVKYCSEIPKLNENTIIENIFEIKSSVWSYEEEVRYLSKERTQRPKLAVKIKRIIFGFKVGREKYNRLKKIVNALNPEIKVEKMKKNKLNYGYKQSN